MMINQNYIVSAAIFIFGHVIFSGTFAEHRLHGSASNQFGRSDPITDYLLDLRQLDLPLMSPELLQLLHPSDFSKPIDSKNSSFIPKQVWIAVRNISEPLPQQYYDHNSTKNGHQQGLVKGFLSRNSDWNVNFCDNVAKDKFMATTFPNTSLLWAYTVLNPLIGKLYVISNEIYKSLAILGTAKAEIWRLAVLYVHGGA